MNSKTYDLCCIGYITRDKIVTPQNTVYMPGGTSFYFAKAIRQLSTEGFLLVTALLIVPAATARHLARTAGGMFWWAQAVALFSGVAGLLLSAQSWLGTASGATIILVACACFLCSALWARRQGHRRN